MSSRFTLGKRERLKSRKIIEQLFREGRSMAVYPIRVQFISGKEITEPLQAGFTASSRHFKKAVDRNRIKRLLREAYRLQKGPLRQLLTEKKLRIAVFFIYTGREMPQHQLVSEKIAVILNKLINVVNEMAAPHS